MSRYFYFLHAFKLPSALIAQGLAEKNTGAKREGTEKVLS